MVKVSVILTTYNSEKFLQRTLDSIFNQEGINSLFDLELIVIDDCSSDATTDILRKNRVDFLCTSQNSGGPNKGRNVGLKIASGNYICFIDHDDTWERDKITCQLGNADKYSIISSGYNIIDTYSNKNLVRLANSNNAVVFKQNETFLQKLKRDNKGQNIYFSTIMIKNELKEIFFEENFGMIDYDWLLKILENKSSLEIPRCLMTRYVNSNNLSLNSDYRRKDFYYSLYTLEKYKDRYPSEVERGMKRIYGSRARYFYLVNQMQDARRYFLKSEIDIKNLGYIVTSYLGSKYVKKYFNAFG